MLMGSSSEPNGCPWVSGRGRVQELLVLRSADIVGLWSGVHHLDVGGNGGHFPGQRPHRVRELGIEHQYLCSRMVQDVLDLLVRQADVDGNQHRPKAKGCVVALQHWRRVGDQECHPVAPGDSDLPQSARQPVHAVGEFSIRAGEVVVDNRGLVRVDE